jgi:hypothetical protein
MNIIALLETLVNGLLETEEIFFKNPKDFHTLETATKATTDAVAAMFMSNLLSSMDEMIYNCSYREGRYNVQRKDTRTLISSVGDITFDCTYYKRLSEEGGYVCLIEEMMGLEKHERFTEEAEVMMLTEALKTSYSEAAKVLPSKSKISKTTVMNKVHQIADEIPYEAPETKKECTYLFIEADEDHVAEQHGRWTKKEDNAGFISRLAYVYEYKRETPGCKGKKELVNKFHFGGLYQGHVGIEKFWNNVNDFISKTYKTDKIEKIFISGDGASWIKSGADYVAKAVFCADKFHLMKYINAASGQMLDEKDIAKEEIWHQLYKRSRKGFRDYTDAMIRSTNNTEPIEKLQTYVLNNWSAVMLCLHSEIVDGCSAEGHVSHVLSDRLSSRPMGWSQTGADRMSKLRCYEKNYGREKIIDLVKYSREQRSLKRTGTDDIVLKSVSLREIREEHYNQAKSYIERIQATIPGETSRKIIKIRENLRFI